MNINSRLTELERRLNGKLCLPSSQGYDRATTPNNTTVRQEPAAVAVVDGAEDVSACVRWVGEAGLRVTMQATGHGAAGTVGTDTLLVDTSRLDGIEVDTERRVALVGAGVSWRALHDVSATRGLLGLSGSASYVGVAGYTFYGGVGRICSCQCSLFRVLLPISVLNSPRNRRKSKYDVRPKKQLTNCKV